MGLSPSGGKGEVYPDLEIAPEAAIATRVICKRQRTMEKDRTRMYRL